VIRSELPLIDWQIISSISVEPPASIFLADGGQVPTSTRRYVPEDAVLHIVTCISDYRQGLD
jgi:hypothetical protein